MNHTTQLAIFWRLFWKEYRVQRAFWLCIAVLAVLLMALPAVTIANSGDRLYWRFAVARILPALFTAACGAMLFATEHESGTYEFQRALPLSPRQLLLGKVAFAFSSIVALYAACWLAAVIFSRVPLGEALASLPNWAPIGLPGRWVHVPLLASLCFALELFLWSVLFSLVLRHPLTAAIAGVTAAAFTVTGIDLATMASVTIKYIAWHVSPQGDFRAEIPLRLAVASLLVAADFWLALRWLGERRAAMPRRSFWPRSLRTAPAPFPPNSTTRMVGRLLWEFWRESRGLRLAPVALFVLCAIDLGSFAIGDFQGTLHIGFLALVLAPVFFPLLGSIAFLFDQHGHAYRFLADRGVRPGYVWLSRQLAVWIAATLLAVALSALAVGWVLIANVNRVGSPVLGLDAGRLGSVIVNLAAAAVSLALLGVAAGQFCSMLFRNGLLAVFFGLLLSAVLGLWYGLMWLWSVNWFWSVLPIPLALLLATRLRAPHWLVERNTVRAWLPVALTLLVPAAAILTAVPLYRATEIPAMYPGFSPEDYARPLTAEEQTTCDLYEKAYWSENHSYHVPKTTDDDQESRYRNGRRVLGRWDVAWVDNNAKLIALALEASRRKDCNFFGLGPEQCDRTVRHVEVLANFMVLSALRLEEQGDLDGALEQYLAAVRIAAQFRQYTPGNWWHNAEQIEQDVYSLLPYWAARPRQTPERIEAAARKLDELTAGLPPQTGGVKREYLRLSSALSAGYAEIIRCDGNNEVALWQLTALWSRLPWERMRALRLLNVLTRSQLSELAQAQAAAERGCAVPPPRYQWSEKGNPFIANELPYALQCEIHVPPIQGPLPYEQAERIRRYTTMVALRRGARLSLMLEAWKLRHGSLPKSIAVFTMPDPRTGAGSGRVFGRELIDPFTGVPFRYAREGVGIALPWRRDRLAFDAGGEIAAKVPFVWSAGPAVIFEGGTGQLDPGFSHYQILDDPRRPNPRMHRADSDFDLWEAGLPIPVP